MIKISLQGGTQKRTFPDGTSKADIARALLTDPQQFSVSEISKAVPMAYSQVHSISKSLMKDTPANSQKRVRDLRPRKAMKPLAPIASYPGGKRPTSKARVAEAKVWAGRTVDRISNEVAGQRVIAERTKALKAAKKLGSCANCGFALLGGKIGGQMQMVHTGMSGDDYVNKVQFCHAYPASLGKS